MAWAPRLRAYSTTSPSNLSTYTLGYELTALMSISTRSSAVKRGDLAGVLQDRHVKAVEQGRRPLDDVDMSEGDRVKLPG